MITIAFSNQKGGVGKTTSALNVAAYMANHAGRRVLAVDLDPQGNFTFSTGYNPGADPYDLMDVLEGSAEPGRVLRHYCGMDLFSIGLRGTAADMTFTNVGREYVLKNMIDEFRVGCAHDYDYCIIDTAPSLNILTVNALTAADYVIIPFTVDAYALQGIAQLSGFIENIQRYTNRDLQIMGMVRTSYDARLQSTKALDSVVSQSLAALNCGILADIRKSADIVKSQIARTDIFDYSGGSRAAKDYAALAETIMNKSAGGAE